MSASPTRSAHAAAAGSATAAALSPHHHSVVTSEGAAYARTDMLLRHDIVNILIQTQHTEARSRARVLERKTALVRYCCVLLRWLDFTVRAKQKRQDEQNVQVESASPSPAQRNPGVAVVVVEDANSTSPPGTSPRKPTVNQQPPPSSSPATARAQPAPTNTLLPPTTASTTAANTVSNNPNTNFVPIPHATLHTLRRRWQQRAANFLRHRSDHIQRLRAFNKLKAFWLTRKSTRTAVNAVTGVETANTISRKRRRQVQLNSVDMQRIRALRAIAIRYFFTWRRFTTARRCASGFASPPSGGNNDRLLLHRAARERELHVEQIAQQKERIAELQQLVTVLQLSEKTLMTEKEQLAIKLRDQNRPPASLGELVDSLTTTSTNSNTTQKQQQIAPAAAAAAPPSRPVFFHAADDQQQQSPHSQRSGASEILVTEKCKTLRGKLFELRKDMTKMRNDVKQASAWIAAECTEWDLKFQRRYGANNSNSNNSNNGGKPAPPSWEYERTVLSRRAAAYDALLEDHRMLQESLKAAEDDIARLRSIAVLREMHSPESGSAVAAVSGIVSTTPRPNRLGLTPARTMLLPPASSGAAAQYRSSSQSFLASPGGTLRPEEIGVSCFTI